MPNQFGKSLRNTAIGAFVALGATGAAQATLFVGQFDPVFGGSLPGISYSGTATFSISQNCLGLPLADATGVFIYAANNCGGSNPSQMSFLGADVSFTDAMGATVGQLHFDPVAGAILGMFVQNHVVAGVQSNLIGPAAVLTGQLMGDQFELVFGQTNPKVDPNEGLVPTRGDGDGDYDDMTVSAFNTTHLFLVSGPGCSQTSPCLSNAAATRFVPEPGSMSLALMALGAGWLARRKKHGARVARTA